MTIPLTWLEPGDEFPSIRSAWNNDSQAPGLLAAGGDLTAQTLLKAYGHTIFPWYSQGQPILWWSPDPRMVLQPKHFRLHRSLRKTLLRVVQSGAITVRFDTAFDQVVAACAGTRRSGNGETWIVQPIQAAYNNLHRLGYAHSVETWFEGRLVGGLYCVAIGRAVFGESMFSHASDASKIALAALVGFCLDSGIERIDCQQNTAHLASLGAEEMSRAAFAQHVQNAAKQPELDWTFNSVYWSSVLALATPS